MTAELGGKDIYIKVENQTILASDLSKFVEGKCSGRIAHQIPSLNKLSRVMNKSTVKDLLGKQSFDTLQKIQEGFKGKELGKMAQKAHMNKTEHLLKCEKFLKENFEKSQFIIESCQTMELHTLPKTEESARAIKDIMEKLKLRMLSHLKEETDPMKYLKEQFSKEDLDKAFPGVKSRKISLIPEKIKTTLIRKIVPRNWKKKI